MSADRRIGILGGTFDPIHVGHLHIASCARDAFALEKVVLVPAGSPPHKPEGPVTDARHRLGMVEAAARDVDGLEVSDLDIRAETPSYSSDLLRRCSQLWSNAALWFIIGADSLNDFHTWHEPTCVLHRARLAVAARPGWSVPEILASTPLAVLREHTDAFESVPLDISATLIRERLGRGLPVDWLVPEPVIAYSRKHALYR